MLRTNRPLPAMSMRRRAILRVSGLSDAHSAPNTASGTIVRTVPSTPNRNETARLWVASIALYMWDCAFGLRVLFFVSFLHVVLEFPLNASTAPALWPSSRQSFR